MKANHESNAGYGHRQLELFSTAMPIDEDPPGESEWGSPVADWDMFLDGEYGD